MSFVADVFDAVLIDDNGDVIASTTLQDSNIDVSVNEQEVRGGKGNQLLATLHSDRNIEVALTQTEFEYGWMAKQLGQDIVTGAGVGYAMPKFYTAADDPATTTTTEVEITLDKTPNSADPGLAIYNKSGKKITGFTVSGNTVDLSAATPAVAVGDEVEVRTYRYDTDPATETITIDNSVFARGVKLVLNTLEIDESEAPLNEIQYQFDECNPTGNFTMNTSSDKSAYTQDFTLRVVKPKTTTEVGRILRIPYTA
jgi:hypothetical protein